MKDSYDSLKKFSHGIEKLNHMLGLGKSSIDKSGLGYVKNHEKFIEPKAIFVKGNDQASLKSSSCPSSSSSALPPKGI